jgi:lysophospholipase L1-like esterase
MALRIGKGRGLGHAVRTALGGGSIVIPPSTYLGQVATRCNIPNSLNAAKQEFMWRRWHIARDAITSLQIIIPNWYVNAGSAGIEAPPGANLTTTAAIEYPVGTFTQVKFSGSATGTVINGQSLVSDAVTVSIPNGATFYTRVWGRCSSGIVYTNYTGAFNNASVPGTSSGDFFGYDGTGLVPDVTMGGTITNGPGYVGTVMPSVCGIIAQTTKPSVFLLGDSRQQGYFDVHDASGDLGELTRAVGAQHAYINAGVSADRASYLAVNSSRRRFLAKYCSHAIVQHGVNDFNTGGATAAQLLTDRQTIFSLLPSNNIYETTIWPITTSSDTWATVGNQTVASWEAQRQTFNTAVKAGTAQTSGYVDVNLALESSPGSGKIKTDGTASKYTPDGVHASAAGMALVPSSGVVPLPFIGTPKSIATPPATFDPNAKHANLSLSNGDLTVTAGATFNYQVVRSIKSNSTGKLYCEFTCLARPSGLVAAGIVTLNHALNGWIGDGTNRSCGYRSDGTTNRGGGYTSNTMLTYDAGDTVCMAVDLDAAQGIWFRKNNLLWRNDPTANPATSTLAHTLANVPGYVSMFAAVEADVSGTQWSINLGQSAFLYSVPAGFIAWKDGPNP